MKKLFFLFIAMVLIFIAAATRVLLQRTTFVPQDDKNPMAGKKQETGLKNEQRSYSRSEVPFRVWATEELARQKKKAPSRIVRAAHSDKKTGKKRRDLSDKRVEPDHRKKPLKSPLSSKHHFESSGGIRNIVLTPETVGKLTEQEIQLITDQQMSMRVYLK